MALGYWWSQGLPNRLVQTPCAGFLFHCYSRPEGLQIISVICDTRYLRHLRLSDGSCGGVRIVGGTQEGDPNVSSAIFDGVYRACAHSRGQRFHPRLRIRDRSQDCGPAHWWSLISDAYPGIHLSLGMLHLVVLILIITGPVAVSVRLLPFPGTGCLRYLVLSSR